MTKIEGYEDCHIVNEKSCKICCGAGYTYEPERYEDGSISRTVYQVPCECIKNGGEIRQGEAAPIGVHSAEDDRQKTCPSPTNTTPLNGGTTQQDGASALSGGNQTSRDGLGGSCERSMGDASTRKDEGRESNPSPTSTKAELVEVIYAAMDRHSCYRDDAIAALDALIAIGAVRVK